MAISRMMLGTGWGTVNSKAALFTRESGEMISHMAQVFCTRGRTKSWSAGLRLVLCQ